MLDLFRLLQQVFDGAAIATALPQNSRSAQKIPDQKKSGLKKSGLKKSDRWNRAKSKNVVKIIV
jgi:hypothetical protein